MGDLIQKLPTDSTPLMKEEKENFSMLFPEEQQPNQHAVVVTTARRKETSSTTCGRKLQKELLLMALFFGTFFVMSLPQTRETIREYIPMCAKSWIITNAVQSLIFTVVLWIVLNSEYIREK